MTSTARRLSGIDRLRGLAIVLMVLDHVLVFALAQLELPALVDDVARIMRITVTRASLPLFGVVAGIALVAFPHRRRRAQLNLLGAGTLCLALGFLLPFGLGQPDVLFLFAVVLVIGGPAIRRWPVIAASLGVLQPFTWPLEHWPGVPYWTGYQPGVLVALVAVGVMACDWHPHEPCEIEHNQMLHICLAGDRLPRLLQPIGRHPVGIYIGHVVVLTFAAILVAGS